MGDIFSSIFGGGGEQQRLEEPARSDAPDADAGELARRRALLERQRSGRSSLVRDPATFSPAGSSGINVQRPTL